MSSPSRTRSACCPRRSRGGADRASRQFSLRHLFLELLQLGLDTGQFALEVNRARGEPGGVVLRPVTLLFDGIEDQLEVEVVVHGRKAAIMPVRLLGGTVKFRS